MSCVDRFYAIVKKDIFLTKKAVKQFFIYFFNDEGASSYNETLHISLQGSGSDLKKDIHDMWHTEAIFDLNPSTFGGNLMSITTDNIIASGIQFHEPVKSAITRNIVVKKVPCPTSVSDIVGKDVIK